MPELPALTLAGADFMRRRLAKLGRGPSSLTVVLTADVSGFRTAMARSIALADRLTLSMIALGRAADRAAGGPLLLARLAVDPYATADRDWISPVCRGWICSSCSPDLACAHRCHPEGHLR